MQHRLVYYTCDNCEKKFDDPSDPSVAVPNINVKNLSAFWSHPPTEEGRTNWSQHEILRSDYSSSRSEYHFCDGKCLGEFVQKRLDKLRESITERQEAKKTKFSQIENTPPSSKTTRMQMIRGGDDEGKTASGDF